MFLAFFSSSCRPIAKSSNCLVCRLYLVSRDQLVIKKIESSDEVIDDLMSSMYNFGLRRYFVKIRNCRGKRDKEKYELGGRYRICRLRKSLLRKSHPWRKKSYSIYF